MQVVSCYGCEDLCRELASDTPLLPLLTTQWLPSPNNLVKGGLQPLNRG